MTELCTRKTWGPASFNIVKAMELYNPDKTWQPTDDELPQSVAVAAPSSASSLIVAFLSKSTSMKRTSLSLFAVLVIVGSLSNEQVTAAQQPAPQSQSASQAAPIPDKPRTVVIPAGSVITVRLVNPLTSSSKTGDAFTAIVTGLIAVGGEVVVPSGVAARGQVIGVKANKKATDKARLKLALTNLTIDGTTYSIQTKLVTTKAQDNSKSTTATTSGELGASAESGLVFKLTAPVTVNRQRSRGTGQES